MRKIKFRGWYGERIGMREPEFNGRINEIFAGRNGVYMQYTGLKDKNGVEIYEGDIVREGSLELMVIVYDEHQCKYKACPFCVYNINAGNGGYTGWSLSVHSEVIGNIYEHPHLLEVGE